MSMRARAPSTICVPCSLNSSKKLPSRGSSLPKNMGRLRAVRSTPDRHKWFIYVSRKTGKCSGLGPERAMGPAQRLVLAFDRLVRDAGQMASQIAQSRRTQRRIELQQGLEDEGALMQ